MATISERLQYVLSFDTRSAISSLQAVGKAGDQALEGTGNKLDKLGGNFVKVGAGAMAFAGVAGMGLWKIGQGASDLNESVNAIGVTFGDAGDEILQMGADAAQSLGLSKREFNQMATGFAAFASTIAGEGGNVAQTIDDLTTRAADFASVLNLDVGRAGDLLRSGLAGETESLRAFGIDVSSATVEAYALSEGITDNVKTMTEAEKVQARYGVIMRATATYAGDFANTSDSVANSQRILKAEIQNLSDEIGVGLLPFMQAGIGAASDMMSVFQNLDGATKGMVGQVSGIVVAASAAGGALLFLAGAAIKAKAAVTLMLATTPALGPALLIVTGIIAAFGAKSIDSARKAGILDEALKELVDASADEAPLEFLEALVLTAGRLDTEGTGQVDKLTGAFARMTAQTPEMIAGLLAAEDATGALTTEMLANGFSHEKTAQMIALMRQALNDKIAADKEAEEATAAATAALEAQRAAVAGVPQGYYDIEAARERLAAVEEEAAAAGAEAWQEWADELVAAGEEAEATYDEMVGAAEDWAGGIRDSFISGADSFHTFTADAETSVDDYINSLAIANYATATWENDIAAIYASLTSGTETEKLAYIAHLTEMGAAGAPLVDQLSTDQAGANEAFGLFTVGAKQAKDGMLGEFDPVGDELARRMKAAQHQMAVALFNIKFDATVKSKEIGVAIPDGVAKGVASGQGNLNASVQRMIASALTAARAAAIIESPSRLFAEQVGAPISEGIAEGIVESGDKIVDSLGKAIDKAAEDASKGVDKLADEMIDAAEDRIDDVNDALKGLWGDLDAGRSLEDLQESISDAEEGVSDATEGISDAELKLAEVRADAESTPEEIADAEERLSDARESHSDAVERLSDAHYKLADATAATVVNSEAERAAWVATATAAGLTGAQIDAVIAKYVELARVTAEATRVQAEAAAAAAAEKVEIDAEAERGRHILNDFSYAVRAGLVHKEALEYIGSLAGDPGGQLMAMAERLNMIQSFFGAEVKQYKTGGIVPGTPTQAQLAIVHGGETIIPAHERVGRGAVTVNITSYGTEDQYIRKMAGEIQRVMRESR